MGEQVGPAAANGAGTPDLDASLQALEAKLQELQAAHPEAAGPLSEAVQAVKREAASVGAQQRQLGECAEAALQQAERLKAENRAAAAELEKLKAAAPQTDGKPIKKGVDAAASRQAALQRSLAQKEAAAQAATDKLRAAERQIKGLTSQLSELRAAHTKASAELERLRDAPPPAPDTPTAAAEPAGGEAAAAGAALGAEPSPRGRSVEGLGNEHEALAARLLGSGAERLDAATVAAAAAGLRDTSILEQQLKRARTENERLQREIQGLNDTVFSKSFKAPSAWAEREVKYKMEKRAWEVQAAELQEQLRALSEENKGYRESNKAAEFEAQAKELRAAVAAAEADKVAAQQALHELRLLMREAASEDGKGAAAAALRRPELLADDASVHGLISAMEEARLGPQQPRKPGGIPRRLSEALPRAGSSPDLHEHPVAATTQELIEEYDDRGISMAGPQSRRRTRTRTRSSIGSAADVVAGEGREERVSVDLDGIRQGLRDEAARGRGAGGEAAAAAATSHPTWSLEQGGAAQQGGLPSGPAGASAAAGQAGSAAAAGPSSTAETALFRDVAAGQQAFSGPGGAVHPGQSGARQPAQRIQGGSAAASAADPANAADAAAEAALGGDVAAGQQAFSGSGSAAQPRQAAAAKQTEPGNKGGSAAASAADAAAEAAFGGDIAAGQQAFGAPGSAVQPGQAAAAKQPAQANEGDSIAASAADSVVEAASGGDIAAVQHAFSGPGGEVQPGQAAAAEQTGPGSPGRSLAASGPDSAAKTASGSDVAAGQQAFAGAGGPVQPGQAKASKGSQGDSIAASAVDAAAEAAFGGDIAAGQQAFLGPGAAAQPGQHTPAASQAGAAATAAPADAGMISLPAASGPPGQAAAAAEPRQVDAGMISLPAASPGAGAAAALGASLAPGEPGAGASASPLGTQQAAGGIPAHAPAADAAAGSASASAAAPDTPAAGVAAAGAGAAAGSSNPSAAGGEALQLPSSQQPGAGTAQSANGAADVAGSGVPADATALSGSSVLASGGGGGGGGADSPWTAEKRAALQQEKQTVEAALEQHLSELDPAQLKYRAVELASQLERHEAQKGSLRAALAAADAEKARLAEDLEAAMAAAAAARSLSPADQQKLEAIRERMSDPDAPAVAARVKEAEAELAAAQRELATAQQQRGKLAAQLARVAARLQAGQQPSPADLQLPPELAASPEGGAPSAGEAARRSRQYKSFIGGLTDEEVEVLQLREELEAMMDTLVRTKVELAETQGDYLKMKRALIRAVEKQAALGERLDSVRAAHAGNDLATLAGLVAAPVEVPPAYRGDIESLGERDRF